jgi:hypothetical protein
VTARVFGAALPLLFLSLIVVSPGRAQTPTPPPAAGPLPAPGFMTPHEITRIVRSAGFDPLAPPLREGTTYVLRATDYRGILMRVVVDAHSGAIRAVNRIVSGPPPFGPIGMVPPPYSPYAAMPPYGAAGFEEAEMMPGEPGIAPGLPPAALAVVHPAGPIFPPLPRPRPAELAAHKLDPAPGASVPGKSDVKPDAGVAAPAAPVPPVKPAPPPLND